MGSAIPVLTFRVDDLHWWGQLYPPSELTTCIGGVSSKSLSSAPPELGRAALLVWVGCDEVSVTMLVLPLLGRAALLVWVGGDEVSVTMLVLLPLLSLLPCGCDSSHFSST